MNNDYQQHRDKKNYAQVQGKRMAYIEEGEGDPIVFLHGNPTSSYLWRNIMPFVRGQGRLIAPDLIGMGDSEKLDNSGPERYGFLEHYYYLSGLLETLGINQRVTLVIHDWGSALGFYWAQQHVEALRGIAFMEAIVAPFSSWDAFPEAARALFQALRSAAGDGMILKNNFFIEKILPASILRKLTDEEMQAYRQPFLASGEDRRPTLSWPRQLPIAGEPAEIVQLVADYNHWLADTALPKLFINADPGALINDPLRAQVRAWPNLKEVTVKGIHYIQEDSPNEIGQALSDWLAGL